MIQIEKLHIKEVRGIRDLTLTLNRKSFVVSGPNGSGKSGVVDAIQFALTGEIGRLTGTGTGDLSLATHGPHVSSRDYPDAAFVRLDVYIPSLNKNASITRKIRKPTQPTIEPDKPAIVEVFDQLARHPEITLSRREIIRFILTEAAKRSKDVQTLLKLDGINHVRATLKTTENKLTQLSTAAKTASDSSEAALKRHLDLEDLKATQLLEVVNSRRALLSLAPLTELNKQTNLSGGVPTDAAKKTLTDTKETALKDIKALVDAMTTAEATTKPNTDKIADSLRILDDDPTLIGFIKQRPFIQSGIDLIDGPSCPLCDTEWDVDQLRKHLDEKLRRCKKAHLVQTELLGAGSLLAAQASRLKNLIDLIRKISEAGTPVIARLSEWSAKIDALTEATGTIEGLTSIRERLASGWSGVTPEITADIQSLQDAVNARPDRTIADQARDFLVLAQERLTNWRTARRKYEESKSAASRGRVAYKAYCDVSEEQLEVLYAKVESDFCTYYRLINHDDEAEFAARFEASEGRLGLLVDFHKLGMFPPGAYHSEGHQDGMGVCLYLALMKQVLGGQFSIAVLDDVVMSVDSQHRKQFCKLLKNQFPDTQFVITTHDRVWSRQMITEGIVTKKCSIEFYTWSVDTGPVMGEVDDVWNLIDQHLAKNDVSAAAARLRHHLEFVSTELADELGASVTFKGDGSYDMGDLLNAVIGKHREQLGKAAAAAQSWGQPEVSAKVKELQQKRQECMDKWGGENWVINKAVHYNEWANLSKEDFTPVVSAIKEVLQQLRCPNPACDTWLSLTPKKDPKELRCACAATNLNLQAKK